MRFLWFVAILVVVGCTRTLPGNEVVTGNRALFDDAVVAQVVEGKSGKNDVRSAFGAPSNIVNLPNTGEQWIYVASVMQTQPTSVGIGSYSGGGSDINTRTVTVAFNDGGIVSKVSVGASNTTARTRQVSP